MERAPRMDSFITSLLEENRKSYQVSNDKHLVKLQSKILDIMGPLTRLWVMVGGALESNSESVVFTVDEMNELIEQSITM